MADIYWSVEGRQLLVRAETEPALELLNRMDPWAFRHGKVGWLAPDDLMEIRERAEAAGLTLAERKEGNE